MSSGRRSLLSPRSLSAKSWPAAWGGTRLSITRQCRYRGGGGRCRLCLLAARRLPPGTSLCRARQACRVVDPVRGYRSKPRPRLDGSEHENSAAAPAGYGVLFKIRPLVILGLCVMLFHFANAPLLPLVGRKLSAAHAQVATAMMFACFVAVQIVMLPIGLLVGHTADSWGRKPLFLLGFDILPIRAVLYTFSDDSPWLIAVQLLDRVGAGVFGALS